MDPNATLKALLHDTWLLSKLDVTDGIDESLVELCGRVAENTQALNDWLSKGGFLPDAWRQPLVPEHGVNPLIDQMLWDVFVTAMEGGVNFWAACEDYRPFKNDGITDNLKGFYANIIDADCDDRDDPIAEFPPSRIDRTLMAKAFERVAAGSVEGWHDDYRSKFVAMLNAALAGTESAADWDAYDAQALVQVGLLGKVVFG